MTVLMCAARALFNVLPLEEASGALEPVLKASFSSLRDLQPGQALGALQTLSMAGRLAPPLFAKYAQGMADFVLEDMLVMEPEGLSQLDSQGLPAALESSSEWAEVHPGIRIKMRAVKVGGASVSRLPFINQEHNSKQPRHLDQEAGLPGGVYCSKGACAAVVPISQSSTCSLGQAGCLE